LNLDKEELTRALNKMQPSLYKGLAISQENNAVKVQDSLNYRIQQELDGVYCYKPKSLRDYRPSEEKGSGCETDKKAISVWVDGFGDVLYQDTMGYSGSIQAGYQTKSAGAVVGVDGHFADHFYAGALGGYTGSDIQWKESQTGSGDIQSAYGGLYFSAMGDMFYANASVIGSWNHYQAQRKIQYPGMDRTASNSHGGQQLLSHLDTGINLGYGAFTVRPFDSFDYITQTEGSFTEEGAGVLDLYVRKSNAILSRNELGLQFAGCLCLNSSKWTLSPKISWVREARGRGRGYTTEFINTGIPFQVTGYFGSRNLVSPGILMTGVMWDDRLSLDLYYNGEFGKHYSDHNYGGQIRFGF
jgi:uncharacterized protein with beta-barrel porin domain